MNIVVIASAGRCGIKEYSLILMNGFRELGHQVRYVGVEKHDNKDLDEQIRTIRDIDDVIIFEYEPGIFWLGAIIRAMMKLRFLKRKYIILSIHEIAPEKYPEIRQIEWHIHRFLGKGYFREILTIGGGALDILLRFAMVRFGWLIFGWLPHKILVHSKKGMENARLIVPSDKKVQYIPHVVKQLNTQNVPSSKRSFERLRTIFITPGFLFRRKRITDVIRQLPQNADLWIVGTESVYEKGYLAEIEATIKETGQTNNVKIIQDYDRMEEFLETADVAVFYYADGYQSGVASLAVGAGKPCIFSEISAFDDIREAGLTVASSNQLKTAMEKIQEPHVYEELHKHALQLRQKLSPKAIAADYIRNVLK